MAITKGARDLRRRMRPAPALTQKQLSEKLGVTQQAISAWMRGVARPDPQRRSLLESLTGVAEGDWEVADSAPASAPDLSDLEDAEDDDVPLAKAVGGGDFPALTDPRRVARAGG